MRRRTLMAQVLVANLILITLAVVTTSVVTDPNFAPPSNAGSGLVLAIAVLLTVLVNVVMLQRRFSPLERLVDAMEHADLTRPKAAVALEPRADVPEEVERLESSFNRMLTRLESERRGSAELAMRAQEEERARIARDLHDEVNQSLTGLLLQLEAARAGAPQELAAELTEIRGLANRAMEELLALSRQLRPTALDDLGLKAALAGHIEEIGRQTYLRTSFDADGRFSTIDPEVQLVAYRVAQEAISNAIQHSRASRVDVELHRRGAGLELTITDDGKGLNGSTEGHGISGMRERALLAGGRLELDSARDEGTAVRLRI